MATRTTLNVSLTAELGSFIEEQVRSGRYRTASEVVRDALRLLEERNQDLKDHPRKSFAVSR